MPHEPGRSKYRDLDVFDPPREDWLNKQTTTCATGRYSVSEVVPLRRVPGVRVEFQNGNCGTTPAVS